MGRFPGTEGGRLCRQYLAAQLKSFGLRPGGKDGQWFQWVPLVEVRPEAGSRLILHHGRESFSLEPGKDYIPVMGGPETWVAAPTPLVFAGFGIVAPEYDYNDYQGLDVRGKIAVVLEGEPESEDPGYFEGGAPSAYASFETKRRILLSRGGVGLVVLTGIVSGGELRWRRIQREFAWPGLSLAFGVPSDFSLYLSPRKSRELLDAYPSGWRGVAEDLEKGTLHPIPLPWSVEFHGRFRLRHFREANVLGVIPGSDPAFSGEYVVVSAHWDHLGIGPPEGGDAIYNGVVDNALGTAGLLEIARALGDDPPARSVLILHSTAEEEGLLGSSFFLHEPPIPLSAMVANINVDGLAFMDRFRDVIGVGAERSELGDQLRKVAEAAGVHLAETPPGMASSESFARSDQLVFAEAGIPSILINEGMHWEHAGPDIALRRELVWLATIYHSPQDDLKQFINYQAAAQQCDLLASFIRAVADARKKPRWKSGSRWEYRSLLMKAREK